MSIIQCPNGHFYNNDIFDSCPNCDAASMAFNSRDDHTVALSFESSNFGTVGARDSKLTEPVSENLFSSDGSGFSGSDSEGHTIALFNVEEYSVSPVVGWLVVIDGPDKGKDFRLVSGRNMIGRSDTANKYQINLTDKKISRVDAVASIAYDEKHNNFIFGAASSGNLLPYVDGQPCMNQLPIDAYSRLELGDTTMLFVPFCCDKFRWIREDEAKTE